MGSMYEVDVMLHEMIQQSKSLVEQELPKLQIPIDKVRAISKEFKKYLHTLKGGDTDWNQLESELKTIKNNVDKMFDNNGITTDKQKVDTYKQPLSDITSLGNKSKRSVIDQYKNNNIKIEKQSIESDLQGTALISDIKQEKNIYEMPPPSVSTVAKKRKKTVKSENTSRPRTRRAQKLIEANREMKQSELSKTFSIVRESDVILENKDVSVIELTDTDEETCNPIETPKSINNNFECVETKRKVEEIVNKGESSKRSLSSDDDGSYSNEKAEQKTSKRTKCQTSNIKETTRESVYEDAKSYISEKNHLLGTDKYIQEQASLNKTITISKNPNEKIFNSAEKRLNLKATVANENHTNSVKKCVSKDIKQVFSPYDQSPVKKKVEAFEKLGTRAETPNKSTRTRAQTKNELKDQNTTKIPSLSSKQCTLPLNRFLPSSQSTTKKNKILSPSYPHSASKAVSTYKISQSENKQREMEAFRKKDALLQASIEDKKRRREEKQLKAQITREALEKEKQKLLENAGRMKQEKLKLVLTEKEEKFLRQKEDAEKKRVMAKHKAREERRKEEQKKLEQASKKGIPKYLTTKEPLLPSTDCFDSDDDDKNDNERNYLPDWAKPSSLKKRAVIMSTQHHFKNTFFCCAPKTVDLIEMFPSIEPRKLKRTSSAVWAKPPRYTSCMSPLNE